MENVVEANLKALEAQKVAGEVFNIACGKRASINEFVNSLREIFGNDLEVKYLPPRPGDIKHSLADIKKASKLLGYNPLVDFKEGLRKTVEWFLLNSQKL